MYLFFSFLSVLSYYYTVDTFVEYYLAALDDWRKNRFASAVVEEIALMIIVKGGENYVLAIQVIVDTAAAAVVFE